MANILIIDGVHAVRAMLKSWLENDGHITREAGSFQEALKSVDASEPDLVIADVSSPSADGLGFIRAMRSQPTKARILATSMEPITSGGVCAVARVLGAAATMQKPFVRNQFMQVIRDLLVRTGDSHSLKDMEKSLDSELEELQSKFERLKGGAQRQRELIDKLEEQIGEYNLKYFPDNQPIKLTRPDLPEEPGQAESA